MKAFMNQTDNNNDPLQDVSKFASVASETLKGLSGHVSMLREQLTPEQKAELDTEIKGMDIPGVMANLQKANTELSNYLNAL